MVEVFMVTVEVFGMTVKVLPGFEPCRNGQKVTSKFTAETRGWGAEKQEKQIPDPLRIFRVSAVRFRHPSGFTRRFPFSFKRYADYPRLGNITALGLFAKPFGQWYGK